MMANVDLQRSWCHQVQRTDAQLCDTKPMTVCKDTLTFKENIRVCQHMLIMTQYTCASNMCMVVTITYPLYYQTHYLHSVFFKKKAMTFSFLLTCGQKRTNLIIFVHRIPNKLHIRQESYAIANMTARCALST